jgi:hypothetical protein
VCRFAATYVFVSNLLNHNSNVAVVVSPGAANEESRRFFPSKTQKRGHVQAESNEGGKHKQYRRYMFSELYNVASRVGAFARTSASGTECSGSGCTSYGRGSPAA